MNNYTKTASDSLMREYLGAWRPNIPRAQHEQYEAARDHYAARMTLDDALAAMPVEQRAAYQFALAAALESLARCPVDDVPFAAANIRAIQTGLIDRAAGILAQQDIDAAMDAVRAEMEFDRRFLLRTAA